ncbi:antitoxin Xre/MbcA/ParS toxin-binding domain-containing protein [Pseudomonas koreensis]|uniref:antitoxin Xre/MbcA/ParS toxin-binding domain-containing protein n=1 Tax=Pseudomonas koreensis TaxID=198620 RepID=UPI003F8739A3
MSSAALSIGSTFTLEMVKDALILRNNILVSLSDHWRAQGSRSDLQNTAKASLDGYLGLSADASSQQVHDYISEGLRAATLQAAVDKGVIRSFELDQIIPPRKFKMCLQNNERLSVEQSDHFYRVARVTALGIAIFGELEKTVNWLSKPKSCLDGKCPYDLLITSVGAILIEEMLTQVAEGFYC